MTIGDNITPRFIQDIATDVQANSANKEDIRRVLYHFCFLVAHGEEISRELRDFLRNAFESYLEGRTNSLDQAIGLIRSKPGRSKAEEKEYAVLATDVLESRLAGNKHQPSLEIVAEHRHCGKTKVGEAWKRCKGHAVPGLLSRRLEQGSTITASEWAQIREIFKSSHEEMKLWFSEEPQTITPEN